MIEGLWIFFWTVWGIALALILVYGLVIFFGAPYVPTLKAARKQALDLMDLKTGELFIDLGSGDGSLLKMAAQRGLKAVGYELNPFLVVVARLRTLRYGRRVRVKWGNFWHADLSKADGVFTFLIGHYMQKFDQLIIEKKHKKNLKVVSHAFKIPGRKPVAKKGAMFLYKYP